MQKSADDHSPTEARRNRCLLALHAAADGAAFIKTAMRLLHASVPCEVVYAMFNYDRDALLSTVLWGSDGRAFSPEYLQASIATNPTFAVIFKNPGCKAWPLSACFPSVEAMDASPWHREFIAGLGMRHAVLMPFWNARGDGVEFALSPHRRTDAPDFTKSELATFRLLHGHIDTARRRIAAAESADTMQQGLAYFIRSFPLPALLVDWDLAVRHENAAARQALAQWSRRVHLKPAGRKSLLPADLSTALEAMKARWTFDRRRDPAAPLADGEIRHASDERLLARISMVAARQPGFGQPSFIIQFIAPAEPAGGGLIALTHLSPRQREVVTLVLDGLSNQKIADRLGRSLNTIKSELHAAYNILAVHSRAELIVRMRG